MKNSNLFLASKELDDLGINFGEDLNINDNKSSNIGQIEFELNNKEKIEFLCNLIEFNKNIKKNKNILKLFLLEINNFTDLFFCEANNIIIIKELKINNKIYIINSEIKKIKYKNKELKLEF